jgi:uncharacterized protein YoxC
LVVARIFAGCSSSPRSTESLVGHTNGDSVRNTSAHLQKEVSLAETLNRVLNKGAVLAGDIIISVADIDLVYIGVNLMVSSVETMKGRQQCPGQGEGKFVEDNHDMV